LSPKPLVKTNNPKLLILIVVHSMNDIVASEKERIAAITRAEAEKITTYIFKSST
jgi:hypothetical protein